MSNWSDIEKLKVDAKELVARYSYQFRQPRLGISISSGWLSIFQELCEKIDAALGVDKKEFRWIQVKEKFGAGRFYFALAENKFDIRIDVTSEAGSTSMVLNQEEGVSCSEKINDVAASLRNLIRQAELKTRSSCAVCGKKAALDDSAAWILTLCDQHMKMRKTEAGLPSFWVDFEI